MLNLFQPVKGVLMPTITWSNSAPTVCDIVELEQSNWKVAAVYSYKSLDEKLHTVNLIQVSKEPIPNYQNWGCFDHLYEYADLDLTSHGQAIEIGAENKLIGTREIWDVEGIPAIGERLDDGFTPIEGEETKVIPIPGDYVIDRVVSYEPTCISHPYPKVYLAWCKLDPLPTRNRELALV